MAPVVLGVVAAVSACSTRPPGPAVPRSPAGIPASNAAVGDPMLGGVISILERLDEYAEDEAYRQVSDRLADWRRQHPPAAGPQPEPLLAALPERLRLPPAFGGGAEDFRGLRDACWLAGVARAAGDRAAEGDRLAVAAELFRWTVRSLAIVADPPAVPTGSMPGSRWLMPGEILLAGRASPPQRAWIFLELLRQAGIDGVMLATREGGSLRPWLPAAIIDGEAYLFEPTYGMPVPGPAGTGIATARQAAGDASVLAALSLPDRPYPLQAADVGQMVPLVAADPWSMSERVRTWLPHSSGCAGRGSRSMPPACSTGQGGRSPAAAWIAAASGSFPSRRSPAVAMTRPGCGLPSRRTSRR